MGNEKNLKGMKQVKLLSQSSDKWNTQPRITVAKIYSSKKKLLQHVSLVRNNEAWHCVKRRRQPLHDGRIINWKASKCGSQG